MISKSATDKKNCTINAFFTKSARSAWGHIIRSLSIKKKQRILLPSYIGQTESEGFGVFDPVAKYSAEYYFYKIHNNLSVDIADFKSQLSKGVDIALIIHYFGFCRSDMEEIVRLCRESNVILVEDCAHAFYLESPQCQVGRYGDFSFFSLHKYIATESGGILKINNDRLRILEIPKSEFSSYDVIKQYALTDFNAIKDIRRRNYALYANLLKPLHQIEIIYELLDSDIPQTFPIKVKNSQRENLYFYLMDKKIPTTALYYKMIEEINPENYLLSYEISREILNLPVHQDTTIEDIRLICTEISNFFNASCAQGQKMLRAEMLTLMYQVDNEFSPPLSQKRNIDLYVDKIIKNAVVFCIWDQESLVGFVALYCNNLIDKIAYITMVAVHTQYRNKGLASNLIVSAINYAKKVGFKKIQLEAYKSNFVAEKLYQKLGFSVANQNSNSYLLELNL